MRHLAVLTALVAIFAILSAPVAVAESQRNDKKTKDVVQGEAQDFADQANSKKDQAKRRDKKNEDKVRDAMRDESDDDSESDDSESDDSDHGTTSDRAIEEREHAAKGLDNAASRGSAKSQEMRARRDERKAIKEEFKAGDKGEMIVVDDADDSLDADAETDKSDKKEKKPWWKFWNQ